MNEGHKRYGGEEKVRKRKSEGKTEGVREEWRERDVKREGVERKRNG